MSHKGGALAPLAALLLLSTVPPNGWAQAPERAPRASPAQLASLAAAAALYVAPALVRLNDGPPACAPCAPADVPRFDRWVIGPERRGWSAAGTVAVVALAGATWYAQRSAPDAARRVVSAAEAAVWSLGITQLAKALIDRNRPVLYSSAAAAAAANLDSQRSLPSGHTAAAFALATSYALHAEAAAPSKLAALAGAAGVGLSRLAARRHFPSDVIAGALLGAASAVVVKEIRF